MPIQDKAVVKIVCDSPDCAGEHGLKATDRAGWTFVSAEVYGKPTFQAVFCGPDCSNHLATMLENQPEPEPEPMRPPMPPPMK